MLTTPPSDPVRTSCLVEYMSGGTWQELAFIIAGSGQRTMDTLPTMTPGPLWFGTSSVWLAVLAYVSVLLPLLDKPGEIAPAPSECVSEVPGVPPDPAETRKAATTT